jgi:NADH:ubiquinone oxidoreductase subunit F (NADH-binding)
MTAILAPVGRPVAEPTPPAPPAPWEPPRVARLLAGPPPAQGAERHADHLARLGRRPVGGAWMLDTLERSGLRGRGGAWFPTARKWATVSRLAADCPAVVVVNLSEGEPLAAKDRTLAAHRPHLILDGAQIAAESVGAEEVILYVARHSRSLTGVLRRALRERRHAGRAELPVHLVHTAHRYVAGEASAAARRASGGPSKPSFSPPHTSERGVGGQPTLVQNAETIAHVALIARFGDGWFRERGTSAAPGTSLVTLSGDIRHPGVYEFELGTDLARVIEAAGGVGTVPSGALIGGYFGTWVDRTGLANLVLTPDGLTLGCGIVGILGSGACGLEESARIVDYLARESAGQCGPCVYGLRAIADSMLRIAASDADAGDLERVRRWARQVAGRGACHHPDGAIRNVETALEAFADHLPRHLAGVPCPGRARRWLPGPPRSARRWR